jgi:hypothetical protein
MITMNSFVRFLIPFYLRTSQFMKLNLQDFLTRLDRKLPVSLAWCYHHQRLTIAGRFPLRDDFLRETLTDTLLETLDETPPDTLTDTLTDTLPGVENLIIETRIRAGERGEVDLWQYQIDLALVQDILMQVSLHQDMCLVWRIVQRDDFASVRSVQKKLRILTGATYPLKRVNQILAGLTSAGLLQENGFLRTHGREVVKPSSC